MHNLLLESIGVGILVHLKLISYIFVIDLPPVDSYYTILVLSTCKVGLIFDCCLTGNLVDAPLFHNLHLDRAELLYFILILVDHSG